MENSLLTQNERNESAENDISGIRLTISGPIYCDNSSVTSRDWKSRSVYEDESRYEERHSNLTQSLQASFRNSIKRRSTRIPLFYCQICLENHSLSDAFSLGGCIAKHRFCRESLGCYLKCQIDDGVLEVRCPCFGESSCKAVFSVMEISELVSEKCFEKYQRFDLLKKNPNIRECPKCSHMSSEGNEINPILRCSACNEVFCYFHSNAHPNLTCEAYTKRLAQTEMRSLQKIKKSTRKCPQCRVDTEKGGGCNHMTCRECQAVSYCK